jgi:hypothetical protein
MPGNHVDTFDDHPVLIDYLAVNPAGLAFLFAGDYQHGISSADTH